jgi:hypothetical protein
MPSVKTANPNANSNRMNLRVCFMIFSSNKFGCECENCHCPRRMAGGKVQTASTVRQFNTPPSAVYLGSSRKAGNPAERGHVCATFFQLAERGFLHRTEKQL